MLDLGRAMRNPEPVSNPTDEGKAIMQEPPISNQEVEMMVEFIL
jgi:hypothetical protein